MLVKSVKTLAFASSGPYIYKSIHIVNAIRKE